MIAPGRSSGGLIAMRAALPDIVVERAVEIGGAMSAGQPRRRRATVERGQDGRVLNSDLPASTDIATRIGLTLRRRCSSAVGAPIECAARISRPVPNGLCSTGRRPFPDDSRRRPTPISPRHSKRGCRAPDRALLHAGAVLFFSRARLSPTASLRVDGGPTARATVTATRARNSSARDLEFGDQVAGGCADVLPVVGVVFHVDQHGGSRGQEVEKA